MDLIAKYEDSGLLHRCEYLLYSDRVVVDHTHRFSGQWRTELPLASLHFEPSRGWARGDEFVPAITSAMSAFCLAAYFKFASSMGRESWAPIACGIVGLLALIWAVVNLRRQEWVTFEPITGGRGLSIRRTAKQHEQFGKFVDAVTGQIRNAKSLIRT